ncbi:MAG: hypothetical protein Q9197_001151 [Variospora fuerteventurae]
MLLNNREARRGKETGEPIDIELDAVSAGLEDLDGNSLQRVSMPYTTLTEEHYSLASLLRSLPSLMVGFHLDPLRPQAASIPTPLPPLASSNFIDAFVAQLRNDGLGGAIDSFLRYLHLLCSNPMGAWNPLRCEGLDVLDCVIGGIVEKASNQLKSFVVRYVCRWFLA